jgi:hypothetical protein
MNIKQALKRKNKLVKEINDTFKIVMTYNSVSEGNERPYSPKESLEVWKNLNNELIELKTGIHRANAPVYDKIFKLGELKNQIKHLNSIDCTSGVPPRSRYDNSDSPARVAEISIIERDKLVKDLEKEIDNIQDFLDDWNFKTTI